MTVYRLQGALEITFTLRFIVIMHISVAGCVDTIEYVIMPTCILALCIMTVMVMVIFWREDYKNAPLIPLLCEYLVIVRTRI